MSALKDVKSYMKFWGWTDGGGPGSMKMDDDGMILAKHGDAIWIANIEEACAILARLHARALGQEARPAKED